MGVRTGGTGRVEEGFEFGGGADVGGDVLRVGDGFPAVEGDGGEGGDFGAPGVGAAAVEEEVVGGGGGRVAGHDGEEEGEPEEEEYSRYVCGLVKAEAKEEDEVAYSLRCTEWSGAMAGLYI